MSDEIRQVSSEVRYANPWMSVREDVIERPDGSAGIYGVVDKQDFTVVMAYERGGFHLVEQYRYPVRGRYWEFPQGGFPAGHTGSAEELARAELVEETGLTAGTLHRLGFLHCAEGFASQGFDVWLATDLRPGEHAREAEEQDMRQEWFDRAELESMIRSGVIRDDSTVAAYGLLLIAERAGGISL